MAKNKIAEQEVVEAQAVTQDFTFDQLNPGGAAQTADIVPISRAGLNYKITISAIAAFINANLNAVQSITVDSTISKSGTATNPALAVNTGTNEGQIPVLEDEIKNLAALSNLIYVGNSAMTDPQAPHDAKPIDQVAAELLALIQAAGGVTGISNGTDDATGLVQLLEGANVTIAKHPTIANAFVISSSGGGGGGDVQSVNGLTGVIDIFAGYGIQIDVDSSTGKIILSVPNNNLTATYVDVILDANIQNPSISYDNGNEGVGATFTSLYNGMMGQLDGVTPTLGLRVALLNFDSNPAYQRIAEITDLGSDTTPWILTAVSDFNSIDTMLEGTVFAVKQGTNYQGCTIVFSGFGSVTNPVIGTDTPIFSVLPPLVESNDGSMMKLDNKFLNTGENAGQIPVLDDDANMPPVYGGKMLASDAWGHNPPVRASIDSILSTYSNSIPNTPGAVLQLEMQDSNTPLNPFEPIPYIIVAQPTAEGQTITLPTINYPGQKKPLSKGQVFSVININENEYSIIIEDNNLNAIQTIKAFEMYRFIVQDDTTIQGEFLPVGEFLFPTSPKRGILTGVVQFTPDDIADDASQDTHLLSNAGLDYLLNNPPQGTILVKGASGYEAFPPGTAGQILQIDQNGNLVWGEDTNVPIEFEWIPVPGDSSINFLISAGRGIRDGNEITLFFAINVPGNSSSQYAQITGWDTSINPPNEWWPGIAITTSATTAPNGFPNQCVFFGTNLAMLKDGVQNQFSDLSNQYVIGRVQYLVDPANSLSVSSFMESESKESEPYLKELDRKNFSLKIEKIQKSLIKDFNSKLKELEKLLELKKEITYAQAIKQGVVKNISEFEYQSIMDNIRIKGIDRFKDSLQKEPITISSFI